MGSQLEGNYNDLTWREQIKAQTSVLVASNSTLDETFNSRPFFFFCGIRRSRVAIDLRLEKSRSAGTGAAPVMAVHEAEAGVTVPAAVAALESGVCRWSLLAVLASH